MQPNYEVADVFRHTATEKLRLTVHQQKTLRAIKDCRTAALGRELAAPPTTIGHERTFAGTAKFSQELPFTATILGTAVSDAEAASLREQGAPRRPPKRLSFP